MVEQLLGFAAKNIQDTYGDIVRFKPTSLPIINYGQHTAVGTGRESLAELQGSTTNIPYLTTNGITSAVSSDATFTGQIELSGATIDADGKLSSITQTVTLNGQTPVSLTTPIARVCAGKLLGTTAISTSEAVYIYEGGAVTSGVPDTAAETHALITADANQIRRACVSSTNNDYVVITGAYASIEGTTGGGIFTSRFVNCELRIREVGTTLAPLRTVFAFSLSGSASSAESITFPSNYIIVPKNHDIEFAITCSAAGISILGGLVGYRATISTNISDRINGSRI